MFLLQLGRTCINILCAAVPLGTFGYVTGLDPSARSVDVVFISSGTNGTPHHCMQLPAHFVHVLADSKERVTNPPAIQERMAAIQKPAVTHRAVQAALDSRAKQVDGRTIPSPPVPESERKRRRIRPRERSQTKKTKPKAKAKV